MAGGREEEMEVGSGRPEGEPRKKRGGNGGSESRRWRRERRKEEEEIEGGSKWRQ